MALGTERLAFATLTVLAILNSKYLPEAAIYETKRITKLNEKKSECRD